MEQCNEQREAEPPQGILLRSPFPSQDGNSQQKLRRSKTKKYPGYKCFWVPCHAPSTDQNGLLCS